MSISIFPVETRSPGLVVDIIKYTDGETIIIIIIITGLRPIYVIFFKFLPISFQMKNNDDMWPRLKQG